MALKPPSKPLKEAKEIKFGLYATVARVSFAMKIKPFVFVPTLVLIFSIVVCPLSAGNIYESGKESGAIDIKLCDSSPVFSEPNLEKETGVVIEKGAALKLYYIEGDFAKTSEGYIEGKAICY